MKRLLLGLSFIISSFSSVAAQSFQFTDLEGNPVADGTVITVNTLNEEGQMVVPLKVKNISGNNAAVGMYENIDGMPNGEWQTCAFGNCMTLQSTGYSSKSIVADDYFTGIQTEWIPTAGSYATWEATLQIHEFNIESKMQFGQLIETVGEEVIAYGPKVTIRFEYTDPNAQEEELVWWGYVGIDECSGIGVEEPSTYDCATFYPGNDPTAGGKTIHAVRFNLGTTNVKNVKVWIAESLPNSIKTDVLQLANVTNPVVGLNEVTLDTPYTIPSTGVYVGYTFTITKVETEEDAYPVYCGGSNKSRSLILRYTSSSWQTLSGYGRLFLQLQLSGEFPYKNAVSSSVKNLGESIAAIGGTATAYLSLTNQGTHPVNSFDYTITTDGVASAEQHIDLQNPLDFSITRVFNIDVKGDDVAGTKTKTLTVTKVNGVPNEYDTTVEPVFAMSTVSQIVPKSVVVEEYTGTTCGWCPRGIVGMEKIRRAFGDKAIGIAIHRYTGKSNDAMYIGTYSQVSFSGAPSARINRGPEVDPYYGSRYNIADDINFELAIPAKAAIDVTGLWSADYKKVHATSTIKNVLPGEKYKIEYVLIADSLTGKTKPWRQDNYYDKSYGQYTSASQLPEDLRFLFNIGPSFYPVFNDVAIDVVKSAQTTAPGVLGLDETVENTCTLTMPSDVTLKAAITLERVAVVALLIDSKGSIANASRFYIKDVMPDAIVNASAPTSTEQRYSLEGHRLQQAKKGLNIIRHADGTTRKVIVR